MKARSSFILETLFAHVLPFSPHPLYMFCVLKHKGNIPDTCVQRLKLLTLMLENSLIHKQASVADITLLLYTTFGTIIFPSPHH